MLRLLHTADVHLGARHADLGDRAATQRERQFAAFVTTIDLALAEKGFASDPKRCVSCRASRRASRDTGYTASDLGGPRGYERSAPTREYFAVLCSECGNQAQVPFRPRMDRPVYCSDCFRKANPD